MPLPPATDAEPTGSVLPEAGIVEPAGHRHERSCFWRIDEARWSCDRSGTGSEQNKSG